MAAVGEDGEDGDGVDEDDLDDGLPGADPGVDARRVRHSLRQESTFYERIVKKIGFLSRK